MSLSVLPAAYTRSADVVNGAMDKKLSQGLTNCREWMHNAIMFRLPDYNIVTRTRRELEIEAWLRRRAWYCPKTDSFILDANLRVDDLTHRGARFAPHEESKIHWAVQSKTE